MEPISNYESAFEELSKITAAIESEAVSVDILAAQVKRASELIHYCQNRLRTTETEVNKIIRQMESENRPKSGNSKTNPAE